MFTTATAPSTRPDAPRGAKSWPAPAAVAAAHLRLAFGGNVVLEDVTFALERGSFVLLRGGNGSGKTCLLNVLSGYEPDFDGSVVLNLPGGAFDPRHVSPGQLARAGVGRLWQDIRLFPGLSVLENVLTATPAMTRRHLPWAALPGALWGRPEEESARATALATLARFGMEHRGESRCDQLSVGQMKKAALARLLQLQPSLLLLDEPLAGLDERAARDLIADLVRLRDDGGLSILAIEHGENGLSDAADEIWVLRNGRMEVDR